LHNFSATGIAGALPGQLPYEDGNQNPNAPMQFGPQGLAISGRSLYIATDEGVIVVNNLP
jgi:hypothetical protein